MSDRIAVMMNGNILQFDTPDAIYTNPSDLRVAEFVGSPRINLMYGQVENHIVKIDGIHENTLIPSALHIETDAPDGAKVVIAFRSENARISEANTAEIQGHIQHIENLGSDTYYYIASTASADPIIVRTAAKSERLKINTPVGVVLESIPLLFFIEGPRIEARLVGDRAQHSSVLSA